MPLDREPLVLRHNLFAQPGPPWRRTALAFRQAGLRCACRIDWMMFFSRDRCRKHVIPDRSGEGNSWPKFGRQRFGGGV
jgi:hypothetical protein